MRSFGIAMAALVVAALVTQASALEHASSQYVGGGTAVVRSDGRPVVDNGALVCSASAGTGVGGGCIAWAAAPWADSVYVDDVRFPDVAYQVCVDNDGDSVCGGLQDARCPDQQFFSHDDSGAFFNPLGALPKAFIKGCPGGFPGWVVFLCTGVHQATDPASGAPGEAHEHPASSGTIKATTGGSGYGNFCGGNGEGTNNPAVAKAYVVE